MDRRETLKTLMAGSVAGAALGIVSCTPEAKQDPGDMGTSELYGRLPHEKEWDSRVNGEVYLNEHELATIAVLCDIILPATATAGSATEAGVVEFVDFIVKDLPSHQLGIRGGLMWLDSESNRRYDKRFIDCSTGEQMAIVEDIAYPDPENKKPAMAPGIKFFSKMRDLTLTGYYTSRMGFDDLGYKGNTPNMWDGVPEDVLKDHDVNYDPEWVAKCINQDTRETIAEWDENGRLLN